MEMKIIGITKEEALSIIECLKPTGLFIFNDNNYFIGIDNSTSKCWVEEFITEDLCVKWLKGETEMSDLELEKRTKIVSRNSKDQLK
jgi:hypothetical protein